MSFITRDAELPFQRGQVYLDTADTTSGQGMLGNRFSVKDYDYTTQPSGAKGLRTNRFVQLMPVRNVSGIALLPRRNVVFKAGKFGLEVDGYGTTDNAEFAGVVDEYLPSTGAAANSIFYIVVEGPTTILTNLANGETNSFAEGARLGVLTAATSQATTAGRFQQALFIATVQTGKTVLDAAWNARVRALSANTTNQTNRQVLVEILSY